MSAAIEARTLSKRYGSIEAVRGIDLEVAAGETVALLGPNGAGKSTTIDMILGLSEPDGGAVSVFGGTPAAAIGGGLVGAMLQSGALIRDLSVRELIAMVASLYPQPLEVEDALQLTGLEEAASQRSVLYSIAQFIPSYWLVQASHVALGGKAWDTKGWLVVIGWTVVLAVLARQAYRRDTARL